MTFYLFKLHLLNIFDYILNKNMYKIIEKLKKSNAQFCLKCVIYSISEEICLVNAASNFYNFENTYKDSIINGLGRNLFTFYFKTNSLEL